MKYSNFEPLPPTEDEKAKHTEIHNKIRTEIDKFVKDNSLVELECDYLGMDTYYYDNLKKQMYKINNLGKIELDSDPHILQLNNLPIVDNYVNPSNWWNIKTRTNY